MQTTYDKYSALVVLPPSFLLVASASAWFAYSLPSREGLRFISFLAGILLVTAGLTIRIWAVRTLGRFFSAKLEIQNEHQLVTTGPFRWIRHPSYSGAIIMITAPLLLYGQILYWSIGTIIITAAYLYRIAREEQMLRDHFGATYSAYQQTTKKILPFVV